MEKYYGTLCLVVLKNQIIWCHLRNSSRIFWSIGILGIEYVLILNTMLVFRLLKHVCLYFICYYLNRGQLCGTALFCTLLTYVVKKRTFYLIDMSCTLLWQINPVGFQSLRVFCEYRWTYVIKTFLNWIQQGALCRRMTATRGQLHVRARIQLRVWCGRKCVNFTPGATTSLTLWYLSHLSDGLISRAACNNNKEKSKS